MDISEVIRLACTCFSGATGSLFTLFWGSYQDPVKEHLSYAKCREREWLKGFYSLPWNNTQLILFPHSPQSFSISLSKVELLQCLHSCLSFTHWGEIVSRKTTQTQSLKSRIEARCTFFITAKKKLRSDPLEQGNNFCCLLFSHSIKTRRTKEILGSEPVRCWGGISLPGAQWRMKRREQFTESCFYSVHEGSNTRGVVMRKNILNKLLNAPE